MKQSFIIFLISFFITSSHFAIAQDIVADTTYVKQKKNEKTVSVPSRRADFMMVRYFEGDDLVEQKMFSTQSGNLASHKFYKDGRPSGKWKYYNEAGAVIRERNFDKLVYGDCPDKNSITEPDFIISAFEGGETALMKYLTSKIKYPSESHNNRTRGILYIAFIVNEKGKAIPSRICDNGLDGYCDLIVWEIVENMPTWTPGIKDGENIEVNFYLPVFFKFR